MKILQAYIGKTVVASIALVTIMLVGLQVFILFVNQLDDLGKGNFGLMQAAWYVLLQTPYQVYLFFPMASLLGCLIGLGVMANHRELVVMRAAGVSITQITIVVSKVAVLLVIVMTLVGESVIPWMERQGNDYKMMMLSKGQTLRTARGLWIRNQHDFINIGYVMPDNSLLKVYQYHFSSDRQLLFARSIEKVTFENGQWLAQNVLQTDFHGDSTEKQHWQTMPWEIKVKPKILKVSAVDPDEMTLLELRRYIKAQKQSQQTAQNYELAFWQRSIQPLTTLVMMMLAIPFIFGPLRSSTLGSKFLAGASVGFGFHVINRFFGPVSQVFQWPPILAGIGPTIVFAILGIYLMRRMR